MLAIRPRKCLKNRNLNGSVLTLRFIASLETVSYLVCGREVQGKENFKRSDGYFTWKTAKKLRNSWNFNLFHVFFQKNLTNRFFVCIIFILETLFNLFGKRGSYSETF